MEQTKKYTIWDFDKLSMTSTQGRAKLRFGIYNNNPRITIYTNDENDKKNNMGMITAPMDPLVFSTFLAKISECISSPPNTKFSIQNYTMKMADGEEKPKKVHLNDIYGGKDENGVIWISVVEGNRPKFKFEFGNYPFHKFYKTDGEEMSRAELSQLSAKAAVNLFSDILSNYITSNYEHVVNTYKPRNKGNYNKGNYNRGNYNNNNNNNNNSNNEIADDDLPF